MGSQIRSWSFLSLSPLGIRQHLSTAWFLASLVRYLLHPPICVTSFQFTVVLWRWTSSTPSHTSVFASWRSGNGLHCEVGGSDKSCPEDGVWVLSGKEHEWKHNRDNKNAHWGGQISRVVSYYQLNWAFSWKLTFCFCLARAFCISTRLEDIHVVHSS